MTLIEEAELDRLPQLHSKEYNPAFNSLTKIQTKFSNSEDSELSADGKCKILSQLQELFGF